MYAAHPGTGRRRRLVGVVERQARLVHVGRVPTSPASSSRSPARRSSTSGLCRMAATCAGVRFAANPPSASKVLVTRRAGTTLRSFVIAAWASRAGFQHHDVAGVDGGRRCEQRRSGHGGGRGRGSKAGDGCHQHHGGARHSEAESSARRLLMKASGHRRWNCGGASVERCRASVAFDKVRWDVSAGRAYSPTIGPAPAFRDPARGTFTLP